MDLTKGQETRVWPRLTNDVVFTHACLGHERWCLAWVGTRRSAFKGEATTGRLTRLDLNIQDVADMAVSPDGKLLALSSGLGYGKVWNTATFQEVASFSGLQQDANTLTYSPDGNAIGTISWPGARLHIWRAPSWAQIEAAERQETNPRPVR